jgi:tRNA modification GTPase
MTDPSRPRVIQLTPPGRGAIATLLVEGPSAAKLVASGFRSASGRPLGSCPVRQIVFGQFRVGEHLGEDVVVSRRSEESVELHCHGGHVAVARIRDGLIQAGCRAMSWQDWAAEQLPDPIAAAARIALADARTERTAAVLLDQYRGALRRAVQSIDQALASGQIGAAAGQLDALLARADLGRHLVAPWRVILAGAPNVGKSSLINALVGYCRAIVHPTAGTTRDVVAASTAIDGWPLELADTAGLRQSDRSLEQAAIELARRQLASADLVLLVFDSSRPWSDADGDLAASWPDALLIHNKRDLPSPRDPSRPEGLSTSALKGEGIEAFIRAVAGRLVPEPPAPGAAVPFTTGQVDVLQAAARAVAQDDIRSSRSALGRLLTSAWRTR